MPRSIRLLAVVTSWLGALGMAPQVAVAEPVDGGTPAECGGVVFHDLDADGRRVETLERDGRPDDVEPGVAGVAVTIVDRDGGRHEAVTRRDGSWSTALFEHDYPVRIEFEVPDGHAAGRPGPDGGHSVQFVDAPAECDGRPLGNLGVYPLDGFCASRPDLAVPCHVTSRTPDLALTPAIRVVSNASVDDADSGSSSIDEWLAPSSRVLATTGQVGTVYGQAAGRDGTLYAAAFTKRHTRLTSELNPTGNPTVIYRIVPDAAPEVFVTLDPTAADPHGPPDREHDDEDLGAMDAVFTSGIGDIELSPDGSTLYAVDLGRRELVEIDAVSGRVQHRRQLDGDALDRTDCAVSATNPSGDLRAFGLGWYGDELLVGVVCSAESSVRADLPVRERGSLGPGAGDHGQLTGYVYALRGESFVERLAWSLAADRGETHANGLVSNDAAWHPWVPAYPFTAEHRVVSYPQPAITDLVVDESGDLVVALGDRWSHQTAPDTLVPAYDGGTRRITETVGAGDLQRACRRGVRWVIEGSPGCVGGFGNGWEFFDGDSYGWQAETALGSVARLPGRSEVVATHMNPITADHAWNAGGLVWHATGDGGRTHGVRVVDGRLAESGSTFGTASGLGDLAVLCGGPPPSIGGSVWHDRDADGRRDPGDDAVVGVVVELVDADGDVVAVDVSDGHGDYRFDDDDVPGGLERGARYLLALADRNFRGDGGVLTGLGPHTGLVPTVANAGDRDDLDSDGTPGPLPGGGSSMALIEVWVAESTTGNPSDAISQDHDFGLRDRYDLSIATTAGDAMEQAGVVAFRIEVRNEGSLASGAFQVRANLPAETSLRITGAGSTVPASVGAGSVVWSFGDAESIPPGAGRAFDMVLLVTDPTVRTIENAVEIISDSGWDEDSEPGHLRGEDDEDRMEVELFGIAGSVWVNIADDDVERVEQPVGGVVVRILNDAGEPVGATTTDASGRFLFDAFPAGSYRVAIPASEFESGRPLLGVDRAVGARSGNVERMLRRDRFVLSEPVVLGAAGADHSPVVTMGFGRRPPTPLIDIVVPGVLVPLSVLCIGFLLLDRRRHTGGAPA